MGLDRTAKFVSWLVRMPCRSDAVSLLVCAVLSARWGRVAYKASLLFLPACTAAFWFLKTFSAKLCPRQRAAHQATQITQRACRHCRPTGAPQEHAIAHACLHACSKQPDQGGEVTSTPAPGCDVRTGVGRRARMGGAGILTMTREP